MNNKYIYCKNCGKTGHNYKKCQEPITSLGIIAIKIDFELLNKDFDCNLDESILLDLKDNININRYNSINFNNIEKCGKFKKYIKFLMISRKSSLGFIEFMRGHYYIQEKDTLINLFKQMYQNEIDLISANDFRFLWKYIWQSDILNELTDKDFKYSLGKYNIIKKNNNLDYCLKNVKPKYDSLEWGFPKGRRLNNEKNIDSAKREFIEETNLTEKYFKILNLENLIENLVGTDNINYKHIYYLALCDFKTKVLIDENNIQQYKEVGKIGWFNYEDSINLIRKYHNDKIKIINNIFIFTSLLINNNI